MSVLEDLTEEEYDFVNTRVSTMNSQFDWKMTFSEGSLLLQLRADILEEFNKMDVLILQKLSKEEIVEKIKSNIVNIIKIRMERNETIVDRLLQDEDFKGKFLSIIYHKARLTN